MEKKNNIRQLLTQAEFIQSRINPKSGKNALRRNQERILRLRKLVLEAA